MAITVTNAASNLTTGIAIADGASNPYLGAVSTVAGAYYVLTIYGSNMPSGLGTPPWFVGYAPSTFYLSFSLLDSVPGKMYVYGGFATATSDGILLNMNGTQNTGSTVTYWYNVDRINGLSPTGTIVQSAKTTTSGGTPGVTLSSVSAGSIVYLVGGST